MANWHAVPPSDYWTVPQLTTTEDRLYAVSRCTRGPGGTPCRDLVDIANPRQDAVDPNNYRYETACPICTHIKSAVFRRLDHTQALENAVRALHPDLPLLPMGEHWNPLILQPRPLQQPTPTQKVKAYVMRSGATPKQNQVFRASGGIARQLPNTPPHQQQVGTGGAQVFPNPPPPVRAMPSHAVPGGNALLLPPPPPVGAKPPHAVSGGKVPGWLLPSMMTPVRAMPSHASQGGKAPSPVPLVGAMPLHAAQSNTPASGSQGPASGSRGAAASAQPQPFWTPPEPAGPPPRRAPDVIDLTTEPRRITVIASAYQMAKAFSGTVHADTGSVILDAVQSVAQSEIASNLDRDESVPIDDADLEGNLSAYLHAVCAGDERPVSSHPMRLAKALVIGALRDRQSDYVHECRSGHCRSS